MRHQFRQISTERRLCQSCAFKRLLHHRILAVMYPILWIFFFYIFGILWLKSCYLWKVSSKDEGGLSVCWAALLVCVHCIGFFANSVRYSLGWNKRFLRHPVDKQHGWKPQTNCRLFLTLKSFSKWVTQVFPTTVNHDGNLIYFDLKVNWNMTRAIRQLATISGAIHLFSSNYQIGVWPTNRYSILCLYRYRYHYHYLHLLRLSIFLIL